MVGLTVLSLLASCAQKKDVDGLDARLKALEEKVATIEKRGGAPASSEEEDAAGKLMQDAQAAVKAGDFEGAKTKYKEITDKYGSTRAAKAAASQSREIGLIGTDAKPIEVERWFQGEADYGDADATLLVFWEVWCPHCKKELPELQESLSKYKAKGIQVVGLTKVTKSATDEKVTDFLKEHSVSFPIGKEKDQIMSQAFNVSGIPAAALVKNGKVVWRGHPARLSDELIDKLMAG